MSRPSPISTFIFLSFLCLIVYLCGFSGLQTQEPFITPAFAATAEELQKNIEEKNAQIEALNKEIKQLDGQIEEINKQGQTLQSTIKNLDVSSSKLSKEIQVTENRISATQLIIEQLNNEISEKEFDIQKGKQAIAQSIRNIEYVDSRSMVEMALANEDISTFWNDVANLEQFQNGVKHNINNLKVLKNDLHEKNVETTAKKQELEGFKSELSDQKKVIESTKKEKATLLSETKNKESDYRKQLEEKKRLAEAFSRELLNYETELRLIIDPASYPQSGKGILMWPLDNVFITQQFGNTAFSRQTGAYNGKGHNGVDFRASRGTRVKASLGGTVVGTGNTDLVRGCYSYGKWILLKHDNGLSTLYAHLDLIKVNAGERVSTGEVIGYSGNTGFSTGPHLHFGVYASQGVQIVKYQNSVNCKNAVIPVADLRAYLDPLEYL